MLTVSGVFRCRFGTLCLVSVIVAGLLFYGFRVPAVAQTVSLPSPAPGASAAPSVAPDDPCTAMLAVVTRPTVTTAACAVKNGRWLVETGYTNTLITGSGGGVTAAYPQALIRVGSFARNVELDVAPPTVLRSSSRGNVTSGDGDTSFGAKWEIGYTRKAVYGVDFVVTEPTGDRSFTAGSETYSGSINGSYALSPEFGLASTISFETIGALDARGAAFRSGEFVPSLTLTAALPVNSQVFAEAAYFSQSAPGLAARTLYDLGYQKGLSSRVQIDVEAGFAPAPVNGLRQHYVGFGISVGHL
jgi:hypothetical protein